MNKNNVKSHPWFNSVNNKLFLKLKILYLIRNFGPIAKQELSNILEVNLTTINNLVNYINNKYRLILKINGEKTTRGRKASLYKINSKVAYIIGIDVGGENFRVILTDLEGNIITYVKDETKPKKGRDFLFNNILNKIKYIVQDSGISMQEILGAGIGISTSVLDSASGVIRFCPNILCWNNFNVKKAFEDKLNIPFFVDDSVRCMAVAEKKYGVAKDYDNFIFVGLGKGVGVGTYIDGKVYRGSRGIAGELGHITVSENGPVCVCGNRGCLEVIASSTGIARRAKEGMKKGIATSLTSKINGNYDNLSVELISKAAYGGDKFSYYLINRTGEYIGTAIATTLNLFGSDLVVLGGGISYSGDLLLNAIDRTVKMRALEIVSKKVKVVKTELGDNNAALGAATSFIDLIFTDYEQNIFDLICKKTK